MTCYNIKRQYLWGEVVKKKAQSNNRVFIYLIAALIFLVPLVVRIYVDTLPRALAEIVGTETYADLFVYNKVKILQIGSFLLFLSALGYRFYYQKSFKPDVFVWLLMAFSASILLSYFFSEHKEVALRGAFERYEGTLTWLSYVALSYSVYTFVENKKDAYILIGAFVLSATVVSIIGTFQYFGLDFFKSELGKKMMLGSYYAQAGTSLEFKMDKGHVYSTLYNPNYVGSMMALAFPLTVYLMTELKSRWVTLLGLGMIGLQMITLVGSRSAGGFFGVAFSMLVMIFYFAWKHPKKKILIPAVCVLLLVGGMLVYQVPYVKNNINKIVKGFETEIGSDFPVKNIEVDGNVLKFTLVDETWFILGSQSGKLVVETDSEVPVDRIKILEGEILTFKSDSIVTEVYHIYDQNKIVLYFIKAGSEKKSSVTLDYYREGKFSIRNNLITESNIESVAYKFFRNEKGFSHRGYIWNRILPLIENKKIFGYGADTFVLYFNQVDILSKAKIEFQYNMVVDKPHNIYLQILFNFGIIGLGVFLCLIVFLMRKKIPFILLISLLGFLIVGIVNDSVSYLSMFLFTLFALLSKEKLNLGVVLK